MIINYKVGWRVSVLSFIAIGILSGMNLSDGP